jgi:hypothetical protein
MREGRREVYAYEETLIHNLMPDLHQNLLVHGPKRVRI